MPSEIGQEFARVFGGEARLCRAPGRVNLIGEHTDYNEGFVLPAAIDFSTFIACSRNNAGELRVHSNQENETAAFRLNEEDPAPRSDWTDYIRGVQLQLQHRGVVIPGANLLVDGYVPIGAGLSSSAAIEVATAIALLDVAGRIVDNAEIAKLCQQAENEFVGARCGIMDQFASINGRAGHALLLDCRSLDCRYVPVPEKVALVICNTMVKHSIAGGEYNRRRAECEECVRYFAARRPGVHSLREVTEDDLRELGCGLSETLLRRATHVISENKRVLRAAEALANADLKQMGQLMYDSHASLRDDYEVSCSELDIMVQAASGVEGTYGARMTGGGFGGCTISLVDRAEVGEFKKRVATAYQDRTGIAPEIYVTSAADGAGRTE